MKTYNVTIIVPLSENRKNVFTYGFTSDDMEEMLNLIRDEIKSRAAIPYQLVVTMEDK